MRLVKSPAFLAVAVALIELLLEGLRRRFRDFDSRRNVDHGRDHGRDHDYDDDNWNQRY